MFKWVSNINLKNLFHVRVTWDLSSPLIMWVALKTKDIEDALKGLFVKPVPNASLIHKAHRQYSVNWDREFLFLLLYTTQKKYGIKKLWAKFKWALLVKDYCMDIFFFVFKSKVSTLRSSGWIFDLLFLRSLSPQKWGRVFNIKNCILKLNVQN